MRGEVRSRGVKEDWRRFKEVRGGKEGVRG
jgi:hypothetical protein